MDWRTIEDCQVLLGMTLEALLPEHNFNFTYTDFIENTFSGRRFSSTIELRIPNSSLESIVGVGGVNLAEIRQV
jgi:hypothetical protein